MSKEIGAPENRITRTFYSANRLYLFLLVLKALLKTPPQSLTRACWELSWFDFLFSSSGVFHRKKDLQTRVLSFEKQTPTMLLVLIFPLENMFYDIKVDSFNYWYLKIVF